MLYGVTSLSKFLYKIKTFLHLTTTKLLFDLNCVHLNNSFVVIH